MSELRTYRSYRLAALRPFVRMHGDADDDAAAKAAAHGMHERLYATWADGAWSKDALYSVAKEALSYYRETETPIPGEALVDRVATRAAPRDFEAVVEAAAQVQATEYPTTAEVIYAVRELSSAHALFVAEASFLETRKAIQDGGSATEALDSHLSRIREAQRFAVGAVEDRTTALVSMKEAMAPHLRSCPYRAEEVCFLGLETFDRALGGLYPGDLCVIFGLTNIGKSFLLHHILRTNALGGKTVLCASAEMSVRRNLDRLAGALLDRDHSRLSRPWMSSTARTFLGNRAESALEAVKGDVILAPPSRCSSTVSIREAFQELAREREVHMLSVDYLTAGIAPKGRYSSLLDHETISSVALELKAIGLEFEVPVVVLAQSKQGSEGRSVNKANLGYSFAVVQHEDISIEIRHANPEHDDLAKQAGRSLPPIRGMTGTLVKGRDAPVGLTVHYEMDFRTGLLVNLASDFGGGRADGFYADD